MQLNNLYSLSGLALLLIFSPPLFSLDSEKKPTKDEKIKVDGQQIQSLQEELGSLKVQIDFLNLKLRDTTLSQKRLEEKISKAKKQYQTHQENLASLASESAEINLLIEKASNETTSLKQKTEEAFLHLKEKLIKLHKTRQASMISDIFSAQNAQSFLTKYNYMRFFLDQDRRLLKRLADNLEKIRKNVIALEERKQNLKSLSEQYRVTRDELALQTSQLLAMLKTLVLEKKLFLKRQEKIRASSDILEKEIAKIEQQRTTESENPKKQSKSKNTPDVPPKENASEEIRFIWPVANLEGLEFKDENKSSLNALEIKLNQPAEVKAAAKGKVLFKGPMGEFGNVIILGHSKGYSTVYGRLDETWVGLGQTVEAEDQIGCINGTENITLHFEIRMSGRRQNPYKLLPKP
ncbi:MAG: peptidoglycan DD-metalloendopeptidase family protein [Candidatus Riflebacteria bacterium]|nr:peptidoglycan DD-metalloendopeptidase family protein [Candidatus Riflebacteria bacterium]